MTGDDSLKSACERLWRSIVQEKLYITGGIGATQIGEAFSYAYDLPNDTAYSETCAAIGLAFFARRMLQMSPQREYGDVMELALYNTVLSGMALDGKSFFYVNPLSVVPSACHADSRLQHVKTVRQKWFGCACCPPNIARIVSSIAAYAFTENEDTLLTHLYLGGNIRKTFPTGTLTLSIASDMPWDGHITVTLHADAPVSGTLGFRLPGWCPNPNVTADKPVRVADGYAYLSGEWHDGETIVLDFPMPVRLNRANNRVREDMRQVAVTRGPITFCAEQADNGENLHLLRVDVEDFGKDGEGVQVLPDSRFGHRTVKLLVPGFRQQEDAEGALYAPYQSAAESPCQIELIPYYAWCNRGEGEMRVWLNV